MLELAESVRFPSAPANYSEFGFKAVNRNVGGPNPPRGANPFRINHLSESPKVHSALSMFASPGLGRCELLRCQRVAVWGRAFGSEPNDS